MTTGRSRGRALRLRAITAVIGLVLAAVTSEIVLRVVYRDGGRTTLGGPGGQEFERSSVNIDELRGPQDTGPKAPGIRRIMVQGDSITWGQGVRDWENTYPTRTLRALNENGARYDMAVYAFPGKEIHNHLSTIAETIDQVDPDIVVYQWYHNDVEISKAGRPPLRAWRLWPLHQTLRSWSYLYFVLDFALDLQLPPRERSYLQYLEEDYADGTPGWRAFTQAFDEWAAYATGHADRTILMLAPPSPASALAGLRQRVGVLARGHGIEVVDLAPHLANVKSASSLFDAHPNALAHQVMADVLERQIESPGR